MGWGVPLATSSGWHCGGSRFAPQRRWVGVLVLVEVVVLVGAGGVSEVS